MALIAGAVLAPGPATAVETESFGVEPFPLFEGGTPRRVFEFGLRPSGGTEDAVRVWNKTNRPLTLLIYGAGVDITGGRHDVASFEDRKSGVGDWVRADVTELTLGPKEAQVVGFAVRAPAVMPAERQTAALVVEGDTGVDAEGVDVFARLALLVRVERSGAFLWGLSWLVVLAIALAVAVGAAHLVRARTRADERVPPEG